MSSQPRNVSIDTTQLQQAFNDDLQQIVNANKQLGAAGLAELEELQAELFPRLVAETQSLLTRDPAVGRLYLAGIAGEIEGRAASYGEQAIVANKAQLAAAFNRWAIILAGVLRSVVVPIATAAAGPAGTLAGAAVGAAAGIIQGAAEAAGAPAK